MGTTAQKLDYLNTTKGKIKDSINLTGAGITNATKFRNYAVLLKDKLAACIGDAESFVSDLITNFPKGTRTGTNFQFNAYSTWDEYYFKGNTYQEQTSGKNLYNVGTLTTTTSSGITFTPYYEDNKLQYINVNGTATASVFYNFERITLPAGSYIANGCTGGTTMTYQIGINFGLGRLNVVNGDVSFTLSEARTMNESFIRVQSGTTVNNVKIYPMIRLSSITDATYEPYTYGPTPNPQYPQPIQVATGNQEIEVCGKNLFKDGTTYTPTTVAWRDQNGNLLNGTSDLQNNANYIDLVANQPYTFSVKEKTNIAQAQCVYINNGNIGLLSDISLTSSTTFTPTSNLRVWVRSKNTASATDTLFIGQLEKSSTPTTYEPYIGNTYSINLGKNLFDGNLISDYTTSTGITISHNADGEIVLNGTASSQTNINTAKINIPMGLKEIAISGGSANVSFAVNTYTSDDTYIGVKRDSGIPQIYSLPSNASKYEFNIRIASGTSLDNYVVKAQVEKGNVATPYSPYFTPIELCKINDYKDSIKKSEGKNLLDTSELKDVLNENGASRKGFYFQIQKTGTYYVLFQKLNTQNILYCGKSTDLTQNTTALGKNSTHHSFTYNFNEGEYFIIWGATNNDVNDEIMLTLSSEPIPYEPYLAKGKWYIEKNIGKVVLDGNSNIAKYDNNGRYYIFGIVGTKGSSGNPNAISNYYKGKFAVENGVIFVSGVDGTINMINTSYLNDLVGFKTWLSTHNTIVYYVLGTPTYTEITNEELINQLNSIELLDGLNNISIASADLPAEMNLTYLEKEEIV